MTTTSSQASTISYSTVADDDINNNDIETDNHDSSSDSINRCCVDVTDIPVTTHWSRGDQSAELDFDLHFNGPDHQAFFKLHGAVGVKASANPPRRSYTTRVYLFILPEEIRSLTWDTSWPEATPATTQPTTRLSFTLAKPPALVMPVSDLKSLTPKNKAFGAILDAMRSLACHVNFDISLPRTSLSNERLRLLVQIFSDRDKHPVKSIPRVAGMKSLYAGRGGHVVRPLYDLQPPGDDASTGDADTAMGRPPPSYEDVVSSPSPPPPPRKRARRGSLASDVEKPQLLSFEARLINLVEGRLAGMECRIRECLEGLDRRVSSLEKAVGDTQANVESVRERLDEVVETTENAVDEARLDLRIELEDFVQDEMEEERARNRSRFTTLRQNLSNSLLEDDDDD